MSLLHTLSVVSWQDYAALAWFLVTWIAYAIYAKHKTVARDSLLSATNRMRFEWLRQAVVRDPRMIDGVITQTLSTTPSFFCNTTILVIGGLLAVLSASDKALALVQDLPFVTKTSQMMVDVKLAIILVVFIYAFFRFSWSMRLYTFVALAIGAMPPHTQFVERPQDVEPAAERTAKLVAAAAEAFNDGLRSYYFAFALVAWLFSPLASIVASSVVVFVLYRREFRSELLEFLR